MEDKSIIEIVEEERANGNITFMTVDGLMTTTADKMLNQNIEGILYDLNRDYATIMTLAKNSKSPRWVNDLALSDLFKEVYNRYIELKEENKVLKEQINKSTDKVDGKPNNEEKPKTKVKTNQNKYKEGFDTDIVFVI